MVETVSPLHTRALPDGATRDCTYAWTHVEVKANGDVRPCCARQPVGNLADKQLGAILDGEAMRRLRRALLTGQLDADCATCRLRPVTTREKLQRDVVTLLREVKLPPDFNAEAYLASNPDVARAGADPAQHYLRWGRLEGRPLFLEEG